MKCEYCDAIDHLLTSCPTKAADRRKEVIVGILFLVLMVPAWLLGMIIGLCCNSFKHGFLWMNGIWPQTWNALRGKKGEEDESDPK